MFSSLSHEFCELRDVFVWVICLSFVRAYVFHYCLVFFVDFISCFASTPCCWFCAFLCLHTLLLPLHMLPLCLCTLLLPPCLLLYSHWLLPSRFALCCYIHTCCLWTFAPCCYLCTSCLATTFTHATLAPLCLVVTFTLVRYSFPNFLCRWGSLELNATTILAMLSLKKNSLVLRF